MEKTRENLEAHGGVQSIERALDLLEYIAHSAGWVGISELSAATGQPVGTVHRLLATLAAREYIVRDSRTRRYALGPAFRSLTSIDPQMPNWSEIATPFLREVVEVSGETANLAVRERNSAVYVAQAQSARMVRMFTEPGNRVALHSSGCGKVLLAYLPENALAAMIAETGRRHILQKQLPIPSACGRSWRRSVVTAMPATAKRSRRAWAASPYQYLARRRGLLPP